MPSDDNATIETGPPGPASCWPSVPIIRPPNGPEIASIALPPMTGPEGIATVVCPLASMSIPRSGSTPVNATRSGSNEGCVGVGDAVPAPEPLVGAVDGVDAVDGVGDLDGVVAAPQAARAAPTMTSAAHGIRITKLRLLRCETAALRLGYAVEPFADPERQLRASHASLVLVVQQI